jgi:hypothetical protein
VDFPCELCPSRMMPEPDEITQKANEIYAALARWPFPEHLPDMGFLFALQGIRVGSEESREVYERLLDRLAIEHEYREKTQGPGTMNGHRPGPDGHEQVMG